MNTTYLHTVDPSKPCLTMPAEPAIKYDFPLDPFQQHAISAISRDENVLVTAKTGSGKTLVGEYQIAHSLAKGKRVFYTTPIKSLSNQKFYDLKQMWPGRVGIMTGDIKFQPTADIVIMTTEILRNLLFKYDSTTRELGLTASLSIDDLDAVIFDEVHYINNKERGRVWEETLILLPPRVNLVLLSATIDAPELFAGWLGNLKKKPIHLISTLYRIVPLTHAVVSGKNYHTIMDHRDLFDANVYNNWLKGRKQDEDSYKDHKDAVRNRRSGGYEDPVVSGTKKPKTFIHQMNETLDNLHEKELLPALFFAFSRKGCENMAARVQGTYLTPSEAASVKHIISFHLHKYKAVFETTNQYFALASLLERGIAYHHSGVLPLLKEMIEILFGKGLVKVLFATETFAVGINMPTKTVVFTGFEKFDEEVNGMRVLHTDEYIQMAGRAGRRGKDKEGLVLYLPERNPIELTEMKRMMTGGKPTFTSRMNFHYDFILKTLQSKNTSWIELMDQSYWKQGQIRMVGGVQREIQQVEEDMLKNEHSEKMRAELQECYDLENDVKTKVNKGKKEAERKLRAWYDEHMGSGWILHFRKYDKWLALKKQLGDLKAWVAHIEKSESTVLPLFSALADAGFLQPFEDVKDIALTELGVLATEVNEGHPLLMTLAYEKGICDSLTGEEILAVLASFMGEREADAPSLESLKISAPVVSALYKIDALVPAFYETERKHEIMSPVGYWNLNSRWIEPVWRWLNGESCSLLCAEYGFYEGNFIRSILKVANLLEEWTNLALYTKNTAMLSKLEGLSARLVRDIVVPESLYLRL